MRMGMFAKFMDQPKKHSVSLRVTLSTVAVLKVPTADLERIWSVKKGLVPLYEVAALTISVTPRFVQAKLQGEISVQSKSPHHSICCVLYTYSHGDIFQWEALMLSC